MTLPEGAAKVRHRLTSRDEANMTGECQACGPVKLAWRPASGRRITCCWNARQKHRGRKDDQSAFFYHRPKDHGLTVLEAREWLAGKVCALCGTDQELVVDHDHATGERRDALCRRHNLALGMFEDDADLLRAAALYLEGHRR